MFDVFRRALTVIRKGEGTHVDGVWVEADSSTFSIKASVQATDAEILQTLPEGYRTRESYTLHTNSKLQTTEIGNTNPDVVIIHNERYQVIRVTPWQNMMFATKHYEVVVVKENFDAN